MWCVEWLGGPHTHPSTCLSDVPSFIHSANVCPAPIVSLTCIGGGRERREFVRKSSGLFCPFPLPVHGLFLSPACPVSSRVPDPAGSFLAVSSILSTLLRGGHGSGFLTGPEAFSSLSSMNSQGRRLSTGIVPDAPTHNPMAPCNCPDEAWPPWPGAPCWP